MRPPPTPSRHQVCPALTVKQFQRAPVQGETETPDQDLHLHLGKVGQDGRLVGEGGVGVSGRGGEADMGKVGQVGQQLGISHYEQSLF